MLAMDGLEEDTSLIRELCAYTKLRPAAIAREAGLANTTINRTHKGKATTRLSAPTMEKLKKAFPDFPGFGGDGKAATAPWTPPDQFILRLLSSAWNAERRGPASAAEIQAAARSISAALRIVAETPSKANDRVSVETLSATVADAVRQAPRDIPDVA